ncbi:MAG TPA: aminotransferase class V-fold PLP-dependent enzyme [Bryobacteraceae bacterium]|nr:aminotransferase class V-fold PLP-dependent enzyme [Bryobacteraceae bacterium]
MNRRDMFRGALSGYVTGLMARLPLRAAPGIAGFYERIGVRPVINCKGTFTIISGSQTLPEVKRAMDEASRHYVHLDELMDGVGKRLAEITRAEWGIITAGCAAALTHATAACIAGADPEKMQRLPDLTGLKNEVVSPRPSRNVYDHAIRMLGVKIITPTTREEYLGALRPSTAMVALLGETIPRHPMPLEEMTAAAHARGIPVMLDAAAERLTIPNVYLAKGVDMVGYSGGKCLRGPQCAGLLLGRKDLLQAAWLNSAPHHAFGRSLKVGKEEIMGMLAAVEAWVKRDHDAEWKQWEGWLGTIREKVASLPTVRTEILQPTGPSNYAPQLRISFDPVKIGATGTEIADALLAGNPRVLVPAGENNLTIMPYMMMPGDDAIAAAKIQQALLNPPRREKPAAGPSGEPITGMWDVEVAFLRGQANHTLYLEERNGKLVGQHRSETMSGEVRGTRQGDRVDLRSGHRYEGTVIGYRFEGTIASGAMTGTIDLGEYGTARFTARRRWA